MNKFIEIADIHDVPWIINVRRIISIRPTLLDREKLDGTVIWMNEGTQIRTKVTMDEWRTIIFPEEDK